jgi:hypothetical protein
MKKYLVSLFYDIEVEAKNEEEAEMKFFDEVVEDSQQNAYSFIAENLITKEIKQ